MHYPIERCVVVPPDCTITYDTDVFAEFADGSSATIPGLSFDNQIPAINLDTNTITQTDQVTTYFVYYSASSSSITSVNKIAIQIEDPCLAPK